MKETDLQAFLEGARDASWLASRASGLSGGSLVADLDVPHTLSGDDLILLCDAHLSGELPVEDLGTLAAAILASDNLVWEETGPEGEMIAEVLWDWSSPDSESGLTSETVALHRRQLVDPPKPRLTSRN